MITDDTIQRKSIEYFDAVNTAIGSNLAKNNELSFAINARSTEIGTISKRQGTIRVGDSIVADANYGLFYFENSITTGLYRISNLVASTSPSISSSVSPSISSSVSLSISPSVSPTSSASPSTSPSTSISPSISPSNSFSASISPSISTSISSSISPSLSTSISPSLSPTVSSSPSISPSISTSVSPSVSPSSSPSSNVSIYYLNSLGVWTALTGYGTDLTAVNHSIVAAEQCCFITNGNDNNRYVDTDGTTVIDSSTIAGHLYNSPKAYKVNFYKNRLYLGDYITGSTRYKNGIMMSSEPLGILSLVDGDHASADGTTISVTDTKYIYVGDSLEIIRGSEIKTSVTVSSKTENTIIVNSLGIDLLSSDEVWVAGTYNGTASKKFRWAGNPSSGINVKKYDTFFLSGGQNDAITIFTNIGDVMLIGNKHNLSVWNNYNLQNMDLGIGCVSDNGYTKNLGTLYFLHYTGIYATTGSTPKLISSKIQKYISGATKAGLEAGSMGKKGLSIFATIGDVTLYFPDGSTRETLSDVCLEYNLQQNNWYVHTGITATHFATYIASDNVDTLTYASTDSNYDIFEFLHNGSAVDDDDNTNKEILFRIDTNNINLSKPFEKLISPIEVIVESERGHAIQAFVSLDNKQFYQLEGEAVKGCTIFKIRNKDRNETAPPTIRNINISLRDYSKSICTINRVAMTYLPTNQENQQRTDNYGK